MNLALALVGCCTSGAVVSSGNRVVTFVEVRSDGSDDADAHNQGNADGSKTHIL